MKSKIVSFLTLILFIQLSNLQAQNIYYLNKQIVDALDRIARLKNMDQQLSQIGGSPYDHDDFVKGDIYYDVNWRYPDVPMRYNIYNDEMEIKPDGQKQVYAIVPEKRIKKIAFASDTFVVAEYELKRDLVPGYFKELAHGKIDLLAKPRVEFREKEVDKGFVEPQPDRFIRMQDEYYIRKKGKMAEKLPKLKNLIEYMGDHQKQLEKYAKENKISSGNIEEITQFISYYNSLE
jgi:hypothetical protein